MTFNEGMQIDTSTTSTGGGGVGRGIAVGGGLGGLVIVLLALFLGVDPGQVISQQPALPPGAAQSGYDLSKCKTGADANAYVECRVVATGNSVDGVWEQVRAHREHLRIAGDLLHLPEPHREQPGAHDMVEEVGLAFVAGEFDRAGDHRRIGHGDAGKGALMDVRHGRSSLPGDCTAGRWQAAAKASRPAPT